MLKLEPLQADDCQEIVAWHEGTDKDFLQTWAGHKAYTYPITAEQIINWISNNDIFVFKILYENKMIGTIELSQIDRQNNKARICRFILKEDYRGKGLGQKVLDEVMNYAYRELNICSFSLGVFVNNENAIRCYKKAGFIIDGFRESPEGPKWNAYDMIKQLKIN